LATVQPVSAPSAAAPVALQTTLEVISNPAGAEIELDGSFSGDAPSFVSLAPGEHTIKIARSGYKPWERKMKTTSGSIKIAAELQQERPTAGGQPAPMEAQSVPKSQ